MRLSRPVLLATAALVPCLGAEPEPPASADVTTPDPISGLLSFPPIRNQGPLGSCAIFSRVYYVGTNAWARARNLDARSTAAQFSPSLPWNTEGLLNTIGFCSWATFPYSVTDTVSWPDEAGWREGVRFRLQDGIVLDHRTAHGRRAVKQALAAGHALTTSTAVYDEIDDYQASVKPVIDTRYGTNRGLHALTIVGYDDGKVAQDGSRGAFRIANSWGTAWGGAGGFCWMSYAYAAAHLTSPNLLLPDTGYDPRMLLLIGVDHPRRQEFVVQFGLGDPADPLAAVLGLGGGGAHPITSARTVVVDVTRVLDAAPRGATTPWFLSVFDRTTTTATGALASARLELDGATTALIGSPLRSLDGAYTTATGSLVVPADPPGLNRRPAVDLDLDTTLYAGDILDWTIPAGDPDGDALAWTVDVRPVGSDWDATTARLTWQPAFQETGTALLAVRVGDGAVTTNAGRALFVYRTNHDPVGRLSVGATAAPAGVPIPVRIDDLWDADGDAPTVTWDFGDGSAAVPGTAATRAYAVAGTYTITATIDDGVNAFRVRRGRTVRSAVVRIGGDDAPLLADTDLPVAAVDGTATTAVFTAVDPLGATVSFSATGLPAWATLSATGALVMTPSIEDTYGAPSTMVEFRQSVAAWPITVTATARGRSHRRSFRLRTWTESTGPLLRPVLRAVPGTVAGTMDLDASGTWSAGGPPTFHWDADGDGRSDHAGGAVPTWTTPVLRPGWNLLTVLVRDGAASMQEHVPVWIDGPVNQGPVITVPASGPGALALP